MGAWGLIIRAGFDGTVGVVDSGFGVVAGLRIVFANCGDGAVGAVGVLLDFFAGFGVMVGDEMDFVKFGVKINFNIFWRGWRRSGVKIMIKQIIKKTILGNAQNQNISIKFAAEERTRKLCETTMKIPFVRKQTFIIIIYSIIVRSYIWSPIA